MSCFLLMTLVNFCDFSKLFNSFSGVNTEKPDLFAQDEDFSTQGQIFSNSFFPGGQSSTDLGQTTDSGGQSSNNGGQMSDNGGQTSNDGGQTFSVEDEFKPGSSGFIPVNQGGGGGNGFTFNIAGKLLLI